MEQPKFYRSKTDTVIGGVAGGLAKYLNTDPLIIRILFVLAVLLGGGGLIIYIVLWIVVPLENNDIFNNNKTFINMEDKKTNFETDSKDMKQKHDKHKHDGSLIGGLILITLGAIFLIDRFVPRINFGDLWPIILIIIGVVLIGKNYSKPNKK
ncbi:MAG: PspC domain-containing protein [Bacteroidales bacterium]|nr:PspC domain-containing protein [Bacteroidales bacterium]